jgi:hypothetical protein
MKEFNIQGKQTSFYKYSPGTFGYTLVSINPDVLPCSFYVFGLLMRATEG